MFLCLTYYHDVYEVASEMIIRPTNTLFMDDISTVLDSSMTFERVKCLCQLSHVMEFTIFMPLLQPPLETFELFNNVVSLLSKGQVVYHGPQEHILEFYYKDKLF